MGDPSNRSVCYIFQDQYPWDIRTEKITGTLAENGYKVHIISRNRDGLPIYQHLRKNIFIHRVSNASSRIARNLKNFPAFFSPFWVRKLFKVIREHSIDLIIVRDLPMSPAAYITGRILLYIIFTELPFRHSNFLNSGGIRFNFLLILGHSRSLCAFYPAPATSFD